MACRAAKQNRGMFLEVGDSGFPESEMFITLKQWRTAKQNLGMVLEDDRAFAP
jgi:hypothetical protein